MRLILVRTAWKVYRSRLDSELTILSSPLTPDMCHIRFNVCSPVTSHRICFAHMLSPHCHTR